MESKRGYKGLQNVHSSNNDFNSLSFLTTSILNKIATTEVVVVRAVNPVACTVDVQPLVNQVDGAGRSYPHSIIHDLPFFRAQGGASGIILDPSEGDIGLVVFAGRDISSVKANRAPSPPGSGRRFDWTDGIYVGGALNSDPSQYIKFGVGITLKTPYPVTVDSPHTLVTGDLAIGTPLAVAYGGTQASTTAEARANLGVPGIDGSGAGGVWPISITGTAAGGTGGAVQWHDITGTGKPADYADVTATSAAMLAAVAELNNIASDSVLSKGEKPKAIQDWQAIQNEYTPWVSEATALSIGSELTVYIAKFNALSTYLSSLTNWTVTTVDTAINATAWSTAWKDYLYAKEALATACANKASLLSTWAGVTGSGKPADNATVGAPSGTYVGTTLAQTVEINASNALANAATANAAIADMASDNILSPVEKPTVILDYANILAEQSGIDTQAAAYGVTTEKNAYDSAIAALTTYLNSLSGWNNTNTSTTIVGTTFRQKFGDVYSTRQTLLNKIAAVAGTLSTWAGVTGSGKPADNANATYVDIYGNIQGVSSGAGTGVNNALVPTGTNQLVNSDLSRGKYGFGFNTADVTAYGVDGDFVNSTWWGKSHVIGGVKSGVLASGSYIDVFNSLGMGWAGGSLENAHKFALKVKQGDRCYIRGMFAKHRLDRIGYYALIFDYSGTFVEAYSYNGGREGGSGDHADLSTFDLLGGIFDVTSPDAAFMQIMVRVWGNGSSGPYWFCRDLAMGKVGAGQTVLPPYTVGIIDKMADETASSAVIAAIWSDNILSRGEKTQVIKDWNTAAAEYSSLYASGTALGAITERDAYKAAYDALYAYLVSLSPSWSDTTQDTPIVGATYRTYWTNFEIARTALINKKGQLSQLDVVGTSNIIDGAVGNIKSWINTGSFQATANDTWYNLGSVNITTIGKLVRVDFGCFGWANTLISSGSDNALSIRVRRDSTTIFENGIGVATILTVGEVQFVQEYNNGFSFTVPETPTAAAHTYYLDIKSTNKDYAGVSYPFLILQELRT